MCERLLYEGYRVVCLDNLLTGRLSNIEHLISNGRFEFRKGNVTEYIDCPGNVDFVLHFASPASPKDYFENPIHTLKVGALGTLNALGLARSKQAVFLLASTSEVYGDPLESPQKESYWGNVNPVGRRSVYDEAKRFAEAITMSYLREHDVDVRISRIFNCYGPRMRPNDGRALPNFINQALLGRPLSIYGDGSQTRSFCYVDDLVEGLLKLLETPRGKFHDPLDRVINLGNPEEFTISEVAEMVKSIGQSPSGIEHFSLPEDDPKVRKPDIAKATEFLNWNPVVSLEQGLERTIESFRAAHSQIENTGSRGCIG